MVSFLTIFGQIVYTKGNPLFLPKISKGQNLM